MATHPVASNDLISLLPPVEVERRYNTGARRVVPRGLGSASPLRRGAPRAHCIQRRGGFALACSCFTTSGNASAAAVSLLPFARAFSRRGLSDVTSRSAALRIF